MVQVIKSEKTIEVENILKDIDYLVDEFDTANSGSVTDKNNLDYFGKITISGMILVAHAYIAKAGKIPSECMEWFNIHFPTIAKKHYYKLACAITSFYLGDDVNQPSYKVQYNVYSTIYKEYKDRYKKHSDNMLQEL